MNNHASPRSGKEPPRNHRFGQPDGNRRGDQKTAALAHAAKRHATEVLAEALDADEQRFNEIVDDSATPYVVKQLLNAFRGNGTLSVAGVRALLAIWQQVFGAPNQRIEQKTENVIGGADWGDTETVLLRIPKYPGNEPLDDPPTWVVDPRTGKILMFLEDVTRPGSFYSVLWIKKRKQ